MIFDLEGLETLKNLANILNGVLLVRFSETVFFDLQS